MIRRLSLVGLMLAAMWPLQAVPFVLAKDGRAAATIVVDTDASARVRAAAANLADYLSRMSGGDFALVAAPSGPTVMVGLSADGLESIFSADAFRREDYLLRSTPDRLYVLGATEVAVEHAVWDLLYRLGHRQYFPTPLWEIIPEAPDLSIEVDVREQPAYVVRSLFMGYGQWTRHNVVALNEWEARNRLSNNRDGFNLRTGHAWAGILSSQKDVFKANPEYLPLLNGERRAYDVSIKFCTSNPGLRDFITDLALAYFEQRPGADSISLDPSDLGNWCQCEHCAAIGPITDRAMLLINQAAEAIRERYGDKYVGMQAFAYHAKPPTTPVQPNVVVNIATSLNQTGMTIPELMAGWEKQGAIIGMREYYGVTKWHMDLPQKSRAANPRGLAASLARYHGLGARFLVAECIDNWAAYGLGHYMAARTAWDIDEAKRADEIIDEFLTLTYGPARAPMAAFYSMLDGQEQEPLTPDYIHRLYQHLAKARELAAGRPTIHQRLDHLVLYAHYVRLYHTFRHADTRPFTKEIKVDAPPIQEHKLGQDKPVDEDLTEFMDDVLQKPDADRQATITIKTHAKREALEALMRHVYRMKETMMVHAKGIYRVLGDSQPVPPGVGWMSREQDDPWKESIPYTAEETAELLKAGLSANVSTTN